MLTGWQDQQPHPPKPEQHDQPPLVRLSARPSPKPLCELNALRFRRLLGLVVVRAWSSPANAAWSGRVNDWCPVEHLDRFSVWPVGQYFDMYRSKPSATDLDLVDEGVAARQDVFLEDRGGVITRVPTNDRRQPFQHPTERCLAERHGVAAIHKSTGDNSMHRRRDVPPLGCV